MTESDFLRKLKETEITNQLLAEQARRDADFRRRIREVQKREERRRASEAIKSRHDFLDWYVKELDIEGAMEDVRTYWGRGCPPLQRVNDKTHPTFVEGSVRSISMISSSFSRGYGYEVYGNGYLISGNEVDQTKAVGFSLDKSSYWDSVSPSFFLYAGILIDPDRSYYLYREILDNDNNPVRLVVLGDMGRSYNHIGKLLGQRRKPSGNVSGHSWIANSVSAAKDRFQSDPDNFQRVKAQFREELAKVAASPNRPKF